MIKKILLTRITILLLVISLHFLILSKINILNLKLNFPNVESKPVILEILSDSSKPKNFESKIIEPSKKSILVQKTKIVKNKSIAKMIKNKTKQKALKKTKVNELIVPTKSSQLASLSNQNNMQNNNSRTHGTGIAKALELCEHMELPNYPISAREDLVEGKINVVFNITNQGIFKGIKNINFWGIHKNYQQEFKTEIIKALSQYRCQQDLPILLLERNFNFQLADVN